MSAPHRAAAALVVSLLCAASVSADFKDSYRKGIEALDRKRWDDVARYMKEAIAQNPSEGERVKLYGLRFETYLPHFYLGAAYLNLGNCDAAVKAFQTSQAQGAIRGHPKYPELIDGLKSCEGQVAKAATPAPTTTTLKAASGPDPAVVAAAVQAAENAVARAEEQARAVAALSTDAALAPTWPKDAALGRAEADAKDSLAQARARLDAGRRNADPAALGEARDLATRAKDRLDAVRQAASQRKEALARREATASPAPAPPSVAAKPSGPPAELLAVAQAYFEGRYDDALRLMDRVSGLTGRALAQSRLLSAAARHAQYRRGGEKDAALRDQAARDVAACRGADPSLAPDPAAFPPPFTDFFRAQSR